MIMPTVDIGGIATHYEISGAGPPILMMAPGGFDSAIEKWSTSWPWQHFLPLQTFARDYTCIAYDRREAGLSGGRVEQLTWSAYADQAKGLLDHLGIASAFLMGSCLGCSPVIAFAARYPQACRGLVLAQPSGGAKRRLIAHRHFELHRQYVQENGLAAAAGLAREKGSFPRAPESGPWAAVIAHDARFAEEFVKQDVERYLALVTVSCQALFDRDTIPGAEPEELLTLKLPALILPGHTEAHATSCARYLEECIPGADYWDVHLESQPPDLIRDRILAFLAAHAGAEERKG
jgi:pimeloyl-ACP methyl ester carboxylesterase